MDFLRKKCQIEYTLYLEVMMKRSLILTVISFISNLYGNPSFTIGSNYYLTIFAYPHDILKWPNKGFFITFNPQTLPWQGDVTNISNRPSESYVNNYQQVEFAPPYGYTGNPENVRSWMRVSGYANNLNLSLGGLYNTSLGKFYFEFGKLTSNMELSAEGVGRASEEVNDGTEYRLVPFQAATNADKDNYNFRIIYANYLFNNPIGLNFKFSKKFSGVPNGYLTFTKEGQEYASPHLTWGWATTGCNHIFGYSHINTDAFFQNSFTIFNGYQLDIQLSYEYKGNYKTGIRYRKNIEDGENYQWQYLDGSDVVGEYYIDEIWKDRRTSELMRAYSKVRFWRIGNLDAGFLFFLQRATFAAFPVNKIVESEPRSNEGETEYIIETNPFFNYRFKGGYIDFGLLLEISKTSLRNTSTLWNSVSRANQDDVLWTTHPYLGWSTSWENFSKGTQWFFATGLETYSSIAIYRRLSLLSRLTYLRKFTFLTKEYGQSEIPQGGSEYSFHKTHERNKYKNENWITGSLGISYGWRQFQLFLTLQLPLAYLVKQETELSESGNILFEHEKRNMWQVQEPTTMRFLLVYALK